MTTLCAFSMRVARIQEGEPRNTRNTRNGDCRGAGGQWLPCSLCIPGFENCRGRDGAVIARRGPLAAVDHKGHQDHQETQPCPGACRDIPGALGHRLAGPLGELGG